jgi:hypothetical protein
MWTYNIHFPVIHCKPPILKCGHTISTSQLFTVNLRYSNVDTISTSPLFTVNLRYSMWTHNIHFPIIHYKPPILKCGHTISTSPLFTVNPFTNSGSKTGTTCFASPAIKSCCQSVGVYEWRRNGREGVNVRSFQEIA